MIIHSTGYGLVQLDVISMAVVACTSHVRSDIININSLAVSIAWNLIQCVRILRNSSQINCILKEKHQYEKLLNSNSILLDLNNIHTLESTTSIYRFN